MHWRELPTPAAVVDLDRFRSNCDWFAARARRLGVRLRPHVKTHKTVEGARLQLAGRRGGLTVSTLAEARGLAAAGFDDLTWAVPVDPRRLPEVADLLASGVRLGVLAEHPATVAEIARCAASRRLRMAVWLEVDCGGARTGLDPGSREAVELAVRVSRSPELELAGLLTHAGQAYLARDPDELGRAAAEERDALVGLAGRLAAAGVECRELSVGSTPTLAAAADLAGVTEARPGNYVFFDAFQLAIGSCTVERLAFTVAATVISVHRERQRLVLNAGALALSRDPGPTQVAPGCGFGLLLDPETGAPMPGWRLEALSQEHGVVRAVGPVSWERFPVGTVVRVVPNHSCLAAAGHDRYHVVRGAEVVGEWRPLRGW